MKTSAVILFLTILSPASQASFYEVKRVEETVTYRSGQTSLEYLDTFKVEADFYHPRKKPIATIILFPTISGVGPIEILTARYFSRQGFLVIVPLPFLGEVDKKNPDTERLNFDFDRPSVVALKLIERSEKMYSLSKQLPVFALGSSQGGIRTVGLTAFSSRIKAAWFAVAGGDFPYIYARSEVDGIMKFRKTHMDILGLSNIDQYEDYLRSNLTQDPLYSCAKINVPIIQVIALKDTKVPTKTQLALEAACPDHKVYRINAGHVSGSASILLMRSEIRKFFMNNF